MRNKHTNKALKNGAEHFNTHHQGNGYNGSTGYYKVKKQINIFTVLKIVFIIVTMLIITFYLITK